MKAIILAAGYGTRLYPYTKDKPKCFLEYNNKKIIDYLLDDLENLKFNEIIVVTNEKFYSIMNEYKNTSKRSFTLISDKTTSNEDRLGAGNDLLFALNECMVDEDTFVIGSDNYFDFSFDNFIKFNLEKKKSCLMHYYEPDVSKLKRTGVIKITSDNLVTIFKEKPSEYISNLAVPPVYIFSKDVIRYLKKNQQANFDSPGKLIENLSKRFDFYSYKMMGNRIDIADFIK